MGQGDGVGSPPEISRESFESIRVLLVGKGVTFNMGGLSIKPSGKMDVMRDDTRGAASVM